MAPPTYRPEIREVAQFGIETTAGTLVAADKRFHSVLLDVDPKKPTTGVRQAGNMYEVNKSPGKGHTEIGLKGDASVVDMIYLLSTLLSLPTFATPSGGTNARTATFAPNSLATNTRKTLSVQKGQSGSTLAKKIAYCQTMDLDLAFTPDKPVALTGKMWGRQVQYGQTLTSSPTTLTPSILFGTKIDVYVASSEAGLSAGQVYPLTTNWKANKFIGDVYSLNSALSSYDALVEVMPTLEYDLVFPEDATAEAFVDSIDTSTLYYLEIIAQGALIEGALYNQLRLRSPIRFSDPGEGSVQDVHTISLKATAQHVDSFNTVGGAILVEAQSTLAAL